METKREIIVMTGYPGSGKTTLAKSLTGFYRIDGDTLKTAKAMCKEADKYVETTNIIFDCTSATKKKRADFIAFAKKKGLPIRCIWLQTSFEESLRRNKERASQGGSNIPPVAFYVYRKQFEEPSLAEGFVEIQKVE